MIKPLLKVVALLIAITALAASKSIAQTEAYIIKGSDTTHGFVQYKKWSRSPDQIKFRPMGSSEFKSITPADVNEVGIYLEKQVERYRSFNVTIDKSSKAPTSLSRQFEPEVSAPKQVFALLLMDGAAQLYNYTDNIKNHYLFKKRNGDIFELISKEYILDDDNKIRKNNAFKKQLLDQTADCEAIKPSSVSKLEYYESSLSKYIAKYNECSGDKTDNIFTKDETRLVFTALAGLSFTKFKLSPTQPEFKPNYGINFTSKAQPSIGFSIGLVPSRSKVNYFAELFYRQYNAEGTYSTTGINQSEKGYYDFRSKSIDLNLGIRYMLTTSQFRSFVAGAVTNGFIVSQKNQLTRNVSFYNSNDVITSTSKNRPTYELGGYLGLGAQMSNIGSQVRYQTFKSFDTFNIFGAQTKHINVLLTYSF